jgi:ATP-dependent DNA ligase
VIAFRLMMRGGHNWTERYPWIVEAARKVRQKRFVLSRDLGKWQKSCAILKAGSPFPAR